MFRFLLVSVAVATMPLPAHAVVENFDDATWLHHEEMPVDVLTDDLMISVPAGGSMRGVRNPNALFPGYDPDRPAATLIIKPRTTQYLTLYSITATDLFQMAVPLVRVIGFRDGVEVASAVIGPFWDDTNKTGTLSMLSGFSDIERVEISSDAVSSDVHFFLESMSYEVTDGLAPAIITNKKDDDSLFGSGFALLSFLVLIGWRRRGESAT